MLPEAALAATEILSRTVAVTAGASASTAMSSLATRSEVVIAASFDSCALEFVAGAAALPAFRTVNWTTPSLPGATVIACGLTPLNSRSGALAALTVTATPCAAVRPPGSRAVTVTVAAPSATPVSVRALPEVAADTTAAFDVAAVYVSGSPSGSRK